MWIKFQPIRRVSPIILRIMLKLGKETRFLNPVVGWVEVTKPFGYAQGNAQQTQKTFSQLPVSGDQLPVSV